MIPIHELLTRVRWDADFGNATFELGYWDRVEAQILRIPLGRTHYDRPDDETFRLVDEAGNAVNIPFHRVRKVWRNGALIWDRG